MKMFFLKSCFVLHYFLLCKHWFFHNVSSTLETSIASEFSCDEWSACLHCSYQALSILLYCHCSDFAVSSSCVPSSPNCILMKCLTDFERYNFKYESHNIAKTLTLDFYYTFHVSQLIAQQTRVLILFFPL